MPIKIMYGGTELGLLEPLGPETIHFQGKADPISAPCMDTAKVLHQCLYLFLTMYSDFSSKSVRVRNGSSQLSTHGHGHGPDRRTGLPSFDDMCIRNHAPPIGPDQIQIE